ncbi:hypothetical protein OHA21_09005 [Actinoplanes sp. NBC_00393]|uniref:hypothetical protein n=1 Tax=Actinoplanes sp. NBC_00393 TaxID=2975953 RepID=UPI002E242811
MTNFRAQARLVRSGGLTPRERRYALRECVYHCAPYGFTATWQHLVTSAGIPRNPAYDPDSLTRAIGELEEARELVLPRMRLHAAERRRLKAAGRRFPVAPDPWNSWGWHRIAYCPDADLRPPGTLAQVVRKVLDAHAAGIDAGAQCLVCDTERPEPHLACRVCGVAPNGR